MTSPRNRSGRCLGVEVEPDQLSRLHSIARERRVTLSALVREWLALGLAGSLEDGSPEASIARLQLQIDALQRDVLTLHLKRLPPRALTYSSISRGEMPLLDAPFARAGLGCATADSTVTQPLAVPVDLVAVVFARLIR